MIAVRMLTDEEVGEKLSKLGFEKLNESDVPDHSLWMTPWDHYFFVPEIGPDRMCAEYRLDEIIEVVNKTRPVNH